MKQKTDMHSYLIESLAPLVFRSGKPFGSQASAQDVTFPLPSAAAGLVRYLKLSQNTDDQAFALTKAEFDTYKKEVLSIKSFGPFLVKFSDDSDIQILVPKPANALYHEDKQTGEKILVRLAPKQNFTITDKDGNIITKQIDEDCGSDLLDGLLHVQTQQALKGKPAQGASFWTLQNFIQWQHGEDLNFDIVNHHGLASIPTELRMHAMIDDDSLTSDDGKLFQTAGFDLVHQKTQDGWQKERLGFLVQTAQTLNQDLVTFGGERRLSHFKRIDNISLFSKPTNDDVTNINQSKGFSLAFITPCIFDKGILPAWIDKKSLTGQLPDTDIYVQLKAMAVDRWQAVSGWDSLLWKPKATRRAVPAGSVYWFELISGQFDLSTLQNLTHRVWSDNAYDEHDGFGLAVLSAWQAPKQL